MMKTRQPIKKKKNPSVAQKLRILETQNPTAEMVNRIQPIKLIW